MLRELVDIALAKTKRSVSKLDRSVGYSTSARRWVYRPLLFAARLSGREMQFMRRAGEAVGRRGTLASRNLVKSPTISSNSSPVERRILRV